MHTRLRRRGRQSPRLEPRWFVLAAIACCWFPRTAARGRCRAGVQARTSHLLMRQAGNCWRRPRCSSLWSEFIRRALDSFRGSALFFLSAPTSFDNMQDFVVVASRAALLLGARRLVSTSFPLLVSSNVLTALCRGRSGIKRHISGRFHLSKRRTAFHFWRAGKSTSAALVWTLPAIHPPSESRPRLHLNCTLRAIDISFQPNFSVKGKLCFAAVLVQQRKRVAIGLYGLETPCRSIPRLR